MPRELGWAFGLRCRLMALGLSPFCGWVCTGTNGFGQGRTQAVKMIGPPCHHPGALREKLRTVVGLFQLVLFLMRHLQADSLATEAVLLKRAELAHRRAKDRSEA